MRVSVKWYLLLIVFLFAGQAMLLIFMLQPQPDTTHVHSEPAPSIKEPVKEIKACTNTKETQSSTISLDSESVAYLYNKFQVSATEVKRQVLKRRGDKVAEVPPKARSLCEKNLVAATYNLWNINPPWPTRLNAIIDLIKKVQPHIIGVQEIRKYEGKNQLDILKERLPTYKHAVYEKVQDEQRGEEEGLGILSQYPIVESSAISFENTNRKCLRALISTPQGNINFFVTHFSLNDLEQCSHAFVLWKHLNSFPSDIPQIVVGDMNTYFDFEWPMDLLTQGLTPFMISQFNPCSSVFNQRKKEQLANGSNQTLNFHLVNDVWEEMYPAVTKRKMMDYEGRWWGDWPAPPGHTFSNYGDQDPSRTDRMYYYSPSESNGATLQLCDVILFGGEPITGQSQKLYPSDHKGVAGHFLLK